MRTTDIENSASESTVKKEINSKPSFQFRGVGALIDIFLTFLLFLGFQAMIMATPLSNTYNEYRNAVIEIQDEYKLSTGYGSKVYEGEESYDNYSEFLHHTDESGTYVVVNNKNISDEIAENYKAQLTSDAKFTAASFNFKLVDYGFSILEVTLAETVLFLIIPLINKRRATIGKFAANTALFYPKRERYATWWQVAMRFFFILIVETALPALFMNAILVMLTVIAVNLIVMLISKKTYRTIRDYLSTTMIIDNSTYKSLSEQMIEIGKHEKAENEVEISTDENNHN